MRLELQHQLHTSEGKLHQLQQGIGSYVSNGPSTETHDGASTLCRERERETETEAERERERERETEAERERQRGREREREST